jgi:hypothetical protein
LASSFKFFSIISIVFKSEKSETSDKMKPPKRNRKPPARGAYTSPLPITLICYDLFFPAIAVRGYSN